MQLFVKLFVSMFFFVYLVRSTPFNSEKLDVLVCTSQFCTLATFFFAIIMKIGFFEAEGVSEELVNALLMAILFLPLAVATCIIGMALHEGLEDKRDACARGLSGRIRALGAYLAAPPDEKSRQ